MGAYLGSGLGLRVGLGLGWARVRVTLPLTGGIPTGGPRATTWGPRRMVKQRWVPALIATLVGPEAFRVSMTRVLVSSGASSAMHLFTCIAADRSLPRVQRLAEHGRPPWPRRRLGAFARRGRAHYASLATWPCELSGPFRARRATVWSYVRWSVCKMTVSRASKTCNWRHVIPGEVRRGRDIFAQNCRVKQHITNVLLEALFPTSA